MHDSTNNSMKWYASAPSNIALIKYMGKKDISISGRNSASNASLSYSLPHLNSYVDLEAKPNGKDEWKPLIEQKLKDPIELSEHGKKRFLDHLDLIKKHFNYQGNFIVRSNNDFPSDCGLASSASSFAALTLCAYRAMRELTSLSPDQFDESIIEKEADIISELSRKGSGSSCRSFYSPWSQWDVEGVRKIDVPYSNLIHLAIIVDGEKKEVSSSQAHQKVNSSYLFKDRENRVNLRLKDLLEAFKAKDWRTAFETTWAEFWDMHVLFETSNPSFGYMNSQSFKVLEYVRSQWAKKDDGPLCTMDAGPNVHLLFRQDQAEMATTWNAIFQSEKMGKVYSNLKT